MTRYHSFQGKAIAALPFFFLIEERKKKSPAEISLRRAFRQTSERDRQLSPIIEE
jgi:hypothetical protein